MPLSRERIEEIVSEVQGRIALAESRHWEDKRAGKRCACCDGPIAKPTEGETECDACRGYA